jgi:hypothetical protein
MSGIAIKFTSLAQIEANHFWSTDCPATFSPLALGGSRYLCWQSIAGDWLPIQNM